MKHKTKNQSEYLAHLLIDLLILPFYRIPKFLLSKMSLKENFIYNYKHIILDICGFLIVIATLYFMGLWKVCLCIICIMAIFHYLGYLLRKRHSKQPEFNYTAPSENDKYVVIKPQSEITENDKITPVINFAEPQNPAKFDSIPIITGLQNLGYSYKLATISAKYVEYNYSNEPLETQMMEAIKHMNTV